MSARRTRNAQRNGEDKLPWPVARENPWLIGHAEAERALLRAHRSGRLPHAWLLTGPQGVGKATLAYRFARFVLSGGGEPGLFGDGAADLATDPDSPVARRVAAAGHADLFTLEPTVSPRTGRLRTEIVVSDAHAAASFLHLTPAEGGFRILVVDCADQLNRHAANALLKPLEEPSPQALLLLVSHAPARLLPTIRSRCRQLKLGPLSHAEVEEVVARFMPEVAAADRTALARLAEGRPGRALRLAEAGGLGLYREMVGLLDSLPALDGPALHALAGRLSRRGAEDDYHTVIELLAWWVTRLVHHAAGRGSGAGDGPEGAEVVAGEAALMARLAACGGLDQWVEVWEKITRLFARAESVNLEPREVVLDAFLALETPARP